jgi:hypothetical protein
MVALRERGVVNQETKRGQQGQKQEQQHAAAKATHRLGRAELRVDGGSARLVVDAH